MALCPTCKSITVSALVCGIEGVPGWLPGWWEEASSTSNPQGMIHHHDARQLPLSAAAGCPLCDMIKASLLHDVRNRAPDLHSAHHGTTADADALDKFETHLINTPIYLRPSFDPLKRAFPQDDVAGAPYVRGFKVFVPVQRGLLTGQIRLFALRGSPAAVTCDIVGRPPLQSSDSPEAFDLVDQWMTCCLNEHEACRETFSGAFLDERDPLELPTRVLQLSPSEDTPPRLLETAGKRGHYLALSHCWGANKPPLKTTQATLQSHIAGIPWDEIPKAYQDAITVTRRLGYHYLWIDSLCILQDNEADWLYESQQMGTVYDNARLTIAASHATDSSQPCFFTRLEPPASVQLPYISKTGECEGSIFASLMPADYGPITPEDSPLDARAWATQEWILSRRMVFYTAGSLVWSCKSVSQRETGGTFHSTARNARWKAIVEKYSARSLTQAGDRMIALEGLRTELGKKRAKDTYCFGLWKHSMPDQLLWYCREPAERAKSPLSLPTWSWASTIHGVRFLQLKMAKNACVGGFRFDEASKALVIRGSLRKINTTYHDTAKPHPSHLFLPPFPSLTDPVKHGSPIMMCSLLISDETCGWGILDEGNLPVDVDIFSLQLMSKKVIVPMSDSDKRSYYQQWVLLLLRKLDGFDQVFVRVGSGLILSTSPAFIDHSPTSIYLR